MGVSLKGLEARWTENHFRWRKNIPPGTNLSVQLSHEGDFETQNVKHKKFKCIFVGAKEGKKTVFAQGTFTVSLIPRSLLRQNG